MLTQINILEKDVEERIIENPSILGLGNLTKISSQRKQSKGIPDMVLQDEDDVRYVVEVQRGDLDPSHIIRLIEYWDFERKMKPDFQYKAILIAENTTRYLNVLSLLQETLPLIVIQMVAVELTKDEYGLFFTKVLDYTEEDGQLEENEEEVNSDYWSKRSNPENMQVVNDIFKMVKDIQGQEKWNVNLIRKYTKHYICVRINGKSVNSVLFKVKPQKSKVHFWCSRFNSAGKSETIQQELQNAKILVEVKGGIDIKPIALESDRSILENIIKECYRSIS